MADASELAPAEDRFTVNRCNPHVSNEGGSTCSKKE